MQFETDVALIDLSGVSLESTRSPTYLIQGVCNIPTKNMILRYWEHLLTRQSLIDLVRGSDLEQYGQQHSVRLLSVATILERV